MVDTIASMRYRNRRPNFHRWDKVPGVLGTGARAHRASSDTRGRSAIATPRARSSSRSTAISTDLHRWPSSLDTSSGTSTATNDRDRLPSDGTSRTPPSTTSRCPCDCRAYSCPTPSAILAPSRISCGAIPTVPSHPLRLCTHALQTYLFSRRTKRPSPSMDAATFQPPCTIQLPPTRTHAL